MELAAGFDRSLTPGADVVAIVVVLLAALGVAMWCSAAFCTYAFGSHWYVILSLAVLFAIVAVVLLALALQGYVMVHMVMYARWARQQRPRARWARRGSPWPTRRAVVLESVFWAATLVTGGALLGTAWAGARLRSSRMTFGNILLGVATTVLCMLFGITGWYRYRFSAENAGMAPTILHNTTGVPRGAGRVMRRRFTNR